MLFSDDETHLLDQPMGGSCLLFELAGTRAYARIEGHFDRYRDQRQKHTVKEEGVAFFSMLELFNNLLDDGAALLDDANIARDIMANGGSVAALSITGFSEHGSFMRQLDKSILVVAKSYRHTLEALEDSFKQTYRHKDISSLLGQTRVVTKPTLVKSRVFETAYILDKILDKKRFLAMSLLLGIMHVKRFPQQSDDGRYFYNQGSVLFTLLTFSYTPVLVEVSKEARARVTAASMRAVVALGDAGADQLRERLAAAGFRGARADKLVSGGISGLITSAAQEEKKAASSLTALVDLRSSDVQVGWSLLGSCLGIESTLLPTTFGEAADKWGKFTHASYNRVSSEYEVEGRDDIRIFNEALESTAFADQASFGISLKASALSQTAWIGPIARVVGWYTSSNHAALTCIGCRTVHGSRVSLVRMWHRCTDCSNVYCWACTGRLQLAATVAIGVTAAVSTYWWGAVSAFYSAVAGVGTSGATGRLGASGMLPAKCRCGSDTEVIG